MPVLPELRHLVNLHQNPRYHCYDVWEHTLQAVDNGPRDLILRWALLLHDVAKGLPGVRGVNKEGQPSDHGHEKESAKLAQGIFPRLGYARPFVKRAVWLIANHMRFAPMLIAKKNTLYRWVRSEAASGRFRSEAELAEAYAQVAAVFLADMGATWSGIRHDPVFDDGRALAREVVHIAATEVPVHTGDLALSGKDVQGLLPPQSPLTVGEALQYLLRRVQNGSAANDAEALKELLRHKLDRELHKGGTGDDPQA